MSPTIHFVRHAQGYHNLNIANHGIHDPLLTPYGEQQCKLLAETFPYNHDIDLIVASPLKRTIYTALFSFPKWRQPIVTVPEFQETSDLPCDTGSNKEELEREFRNYNVDFSLVAPAWNSKVGIWSPVRPAIEERCRAARRWLKGHKEEHIVVVTHGGVLHYLTEDWADSAKFEGTGWANTEYRSYIFDQNSGFDCSLIETEESRTRRRGVEKPLTEAEQRNLKLSAQNEWEREGLLRDERQAQRQEERQEERREVRQAVRQEERREERHGPLRMMAKRKARKAYRYLAGRFGV